MTHPLSPELQAVQDQFMDNYRNGGLPAVEQMVADFAAEAEAAGAFADGAQVVQHDAIIAQDSTDTSRTVQAVVAANEVVRDSTTARSRHSFASFLLGVVQNQQ